MVEVAFYIANKGRWIDRLVSRCIQSPYSHVELIVDSVSYSSSLRDGGVRCKAISYNKERWEIVPIELLDRAAVFNFFDKTQEAKYDLLSVLLNYFGISKKDFNRKRFYCSEWVIHAINHADRQRYNPNMTMTELHTLINSRAVYDD